MSNNWENGPEWGCIAAIALVVFAWALIIGVLIILID
jgi:hypothetical protein